LTEVELYGPLGGPDVANKGKTFPEDPAGIPMFMGHPTHVLPTLPDDLIGDYEEVPNTRLHGHPPYFSSCTVAMDGFTATNPAGSVHELKIPAPPPATTSSTPCSASRPESG